MMKGSVTWVCGELLCESLETLQLLFCLFVLLHCNIQKICFQTSIKTCRLQLYLIAKPLLCNISVFTVLIHLICFLEEPICTPCGTKYKKDTSREVLSKLHGGSLSGEQLALT